MGCCRLVRGPVPPLRIAIHLDIHIPSAQCTAHIALIFRKRPGFRQLKVRRKKRKERLWVTGFDQYAIHLANYRSFSHAGLRCNDADGNKEEQRDC